MKFSSAIRAVVLFVAMTVCLARTEAFSPNERSNSDTAAAIRAVLNAQQSAWNRGDIPAFMNGYARSDATVFVSGDTITRGWQTVLRRYQKKYATAQQMGRLTFSNLGITPLSGDAAVVLGRWRLAREKDHPHGCFTLIFRRLPAGWRIVQDHTS